MEYVFQCLKLSLLKIFGFIIIFIVYYIVVYNVAQETNYGISIHVLIVIPFYILV